MRGSRVRERQTEIQTKKRQESDARQQQRAYTKAVAAIVTGLGEAETHSKGTIDRSAAMLGLDEAQALYSEVEAIEAAGGMFTADGSRRRTPGGIYLLLLKQRLTATGKKDVLKQIMAG